MNKPSSETGTRGPSPLRKPSGSAERVARLAAKELREILRDRRTIITLILMPLLVYPLLSMLFQQFLVASAPQQGPPTYIIGVASDEERLYVQRYIDVGRALLSAQTATESVEKERDDSQPAVPALDELPMVRVDLYHDPLRELETGEIDVAVRVLRHTELPEFGIDIAVPRQETVTLPTLEVELSHLPNSALSQQALRHVERCLAADNVYYLNTRLNQFDARNSESDSLAVRPTRVSIASEAGKPQSFTTLFPLILILMTITGAVYPAIDLTAGERERGTMETLIAAPVPRLALLLGKYVAVMTVALLTATANIIAMCVTILATGMGTLLFGEAGLSLATVVQIFGLMVLFAAFFSAVLLAITSFARSFKEAQAYLIPIMLISIAPGLLSLMPNVQLTGFLVITPLVNIVLLGRDMFEGNADLGLAVVIVLSTAFYALAAIAVAARIFGTDAILYGSNSSFRDLFRRSDQSHDAVTATGALLCLALVFPVYYLLASIVAREVGVSIPMKLMQTTGISVVLFGGFPFLAVRWSNVSLRNGFRLTGAKPLAFIGAVLLGFVLWPFAHEIVLLCHHLGIAILNDDLLQDGKVLVEKLQSTGSPVLILATLAVVPAVLEELFFRGFLMSALRTRTSAKTAIVVSAVLFGAFHIVQTHGLAIERFFPSTFMGLVLGWICYRSGSVLPGMLLHTCHNGLLLLLAYYYDELQSRGWGTEEQSHLPWTWLMAAAVGVAVGLILIAFTTRRHVQQTPAYGGKKRL